MTAWIAASCAAQGVPLRITDPVVLRQAVALLRAGVGRVGASAPARAGQVDRGVELPAA